MKKIALLFFLLVFSISGLIFLPDCKKNTTPLPCDGKGYINFTNKLDSAVSINIVQLHNTFTLQKDYSQRVEVSGDNPYEIKITGNDYYLSDTIVVANCDNQLFVIVPVK